MDEEELLHNLRIVKKILDKHGIFYWLGGGTLLGAVRSGRFIPWDFDVDLKYFYEDREKVKEAIKEIEKQGIKIGAKKSGIELEWYKIEGDYAIEEYYVPNVTLIRQFLDYLHNVIYYGKSMIGQGRVPPKITKLIYKIVYSLPEDLRKKLDSFIMRIYKKFEKSGSLFVVKKLPAKYFKNFTKVKLYDMEFYAPSPVEEYLELLYGKDWRIPKKNWYVGRFENKTIVKKRRGNKRN